MLCNMLVASTPFGCHPVSPSLRIRIRIPPPLPACSAGQPMGIDMFYQQRGQQAQNMLRQVAGDQR
jgi:hypothetical protein